MPTNSQNWISDITGQTRIAQHYCPDEEDNKGFLSVLKEPRTYLPGARTAYTPPSGDMLKRLLDGIRSKLELTFSEKLLELINESGQKPSAIYKKADITKDHFAKIKGNKNYRPSKDTGLSHLMIFYQGGSLFLCMLFLYLQSSSWTIYFLAQQKHR